MKDLRMQDSYIVQTSGQLTMEKLSVLTFLYQPLMNAHTYSLYLTLYYEALLNQRLKAPSTLYRILKMTSLDLESFKDSIYFLEGLGLLKTFENNQNTAPMYIFEVKMPLPPLNFYDHPVFSFMLMDALGKEDYEKTKFSFTHIKLNLTDYTNTTHRFDEVFHVDYKHRLKVKGNLKLERGYQAPKTQYDLDLFMQGIKDYQLPTKLFTPRLLNTIKQFGALYNISPITMRELVYDVYHDGIVDEEDLKERCRRFYENENRQLKEVSQTSSKEEAWKMQANTLSVHDYLQARQHQIPPTQYELEMINKIMVEQQLSSSVMNILIDTVLKLNQGRLPRNHMESLASYFVRNHVTDLDEAIESSRKYVKSIMSRKKDNNKSQPSQTVKPTSTASDEYTPEQREAILEKLLGG